MLSYKRFASKGHDNPASDASIKRLVRGYPIKRNTWGTKKLKDKKKNMANKMNPKVPE